MPRTAFLLKVKPDQIEEYKRRHREVWPEMLGVIQRSGWCNYSLFMTDDGHVLGYREAADIEEAQNKLEQESIRQQWQTFMASLFEGIVEYPGTLQLKLEEVFHLD